MAETYVYRELTWKCPQCDTQQKGGDISCTSCGAARGEVDFSDEGSRVVTEPEKLQKAQGGADWICAYCDTSNRNGTDKCTQCGSGKGEGRERRDGPAQKKAPPKVEYRAPASPPPPRPQARKPIPAGPLVGTLGFLTVVYLFYFAFFDTKTIQLTLQQLSWSRSIYIEHLDTLQEEAWVVPDGGRVHSSHPAIHHYDHVQDGYDTVWKSRQVSDGYDTVPDTKQVRYQTGTEKYKVRTERLKNGFARDVYDTRPTYGYKTVTCTKQVPRYRTERYTVQVPRYRDVPAYRTKYQYEIDRWQARRDVPTRGDDQKPYWGTFTLADREREASRTESYIGMLQSLEPLHHHQTSFRLDGFLKAKIGDRYQAELSRVGLLSNLCRLP